MALPFLQPDSPTSSLLNGHNPSSLCTEFGPIFLTQPQGPDSPHTDTRPAQSAGYNPLKREQKQAHCVNHVPHPVPERDCSFISTQEPVTPAWLLFHRHTTSPELSPGQLPCW
ncbi:hypothetical protein KIL84_022820 [Mauremys mutica]|uniref:Uncharacterized protein n=1 Tax=Mauremys mutica TaxID=74926 RepID=A0A9D3WP58_9SAUR|nr:hypothetical protein KIL84_022820 [Mauremys mutica]